MGRYEDYQRFRERLNDRILKGGPDNRPPASTLMTRRFFSIDTKVYEAGALDERTKELLGLVASMVLRCDDCIAYHVDACCERGVTDEELFEALDIALVVGGSIVIPHLRRAVEFLDERRSAEARGEV